MANPSTNKSPANKTAPAAKPANGDASKEAPKGAAPADKPKKAKRARTRLVSPTVDGFWVRAYTDIIAKFGMPKGPDGVELVAKAATPGLSAEAKAAREASKAAEKAKLEAMSDEQRLAYVAEQRKTKADKKAAKKAAERDALVKMLKEQIARGEI
jgi:hypothetical protein